MKSLVSVDRDGLQTWLRVRFRQGFCTLPVFYQRKIFAEAKAMRDPSLTPIAWGGGDKLS